MTIVDPDRIRLIGWTLLACEAACTTAWVIATVYYNAVGNFTLSSAGLTALASPHTALAAVVVAINYDVAQHCRDGSCTDLMPPVTWYLVPFLAIPFDVLQLHANANFLPDASAPVALAAVSLLISVAVSTWSLVAFFVVREATKAVLGARKESALLRSRRLLIAPRVL